MSVKAKLSYSRISPRKVRLVADLVRGCNVIEAENILKFTNKRPAKSVLKLLRSAIANAENNFNLKKENLYISEIKVDGGPIMKRFRPRARGAVFPIHKKTSHVSVELKEKGGKEEEKKGKKEKIKKVYKTEKPKEEEDLRKKRKSTEGEKQEEKKHKDTKGEQKQIFRRKSI